VSDDFTIDTSEFDKAIVQMRRIPDVAKPLVRAAVQFNLQEIKASWRSKLEGDPMAPRAPYSISYDTTLSGNEVRGEVGANKGTGQQGGVVLLKEYGAPQRSLGARGYGLAALQENLDDLEQGIGKALAQAATVAGW
jgi:hypothetical protein